jgi:hypothetical protein
MISKEDITKEKITQLFTKEIPEYNEVCIDKDGEPGMYVESFSVLLMEDFRKKMFHLSNLKKF